MGHVGNCCVYAALSTFLSARASAQHRASGRGGWFIRHPKWRRTISRVQGRPADALGRVSVYEPVLVEVGEILQVEVLQRAPRDPGAAMPYGRCCSACAARNGFLAELI